MPSHTTQRSIDEGLVLHLPLNEGVGTTVFDRSSEDNHGTIVGTLTWTDDNERGKVIAFDEDLNDYITLVNPGITNPNPFTVSIWIKPIDTGAPSIIIGGSVTQRIFIATDDRIAIDWGIDFYSISDIVYGEWNLLTYVFDGINEFIYLDGRLDNEYLNTTEDPRLDAVYRLGHYGAAFYPYSGSMSDVRIYNRAITEQESRTIYEMRRRI